MPNGVHETLSASKYLFKRFLLSRDSKDLFSLEFSLTIFRKRDSLVEIKERFPKSIRSDLIRSVSLAIVPDYLYLLSDFVRFCQAHES